MSKMYGARIFIEEAATIEKKTYKKKRPPKLYKSKTKDVVKKENSPKNSATIKSILKE